MNNFLYLLEQDEDLLNQFAIEVKRDLGIDFFIKEEKPVEETTFQFGAVLKRKGK